MLRQMYCVIFLCVALLSSSAVRANLQDRIEWQPSIATIKQIESKLKLPKSAHPLRQYKRFYAGEIINGKKVLIGIFMFNRKERGIEITDLIHMPVVFDGGCSVLDFKFLIAENQVATLECHGDA